MGYKPSILKESSNAYSNQFTTNAKNVKDICGYFPCAPFPRLETGNVVWVQSFDQFMDSDLTDFRYSDVISLCRHFLTK